MYEAAGVQLRRNKEQSARNCKNASLLRGLLTCAYCGYKMAGRAVRGYRLYQCSARTVAQRYIPIEERCPGRYCSADKLEAAVWDEVVRQVSDPALILNNLQARDDLTRKEQERDEQNLAALYASEQSLKREANKLIDLHVAADIDRDMFRERMAVIKKKQEALTSAIAEIVVRKEKRESARADVQAIQELCAATQAGLPLVDYEDKRQFLEAMDIRLRVEGNTVTLSGLITEAVLTIVGRQSTARLKTALENKD